MLVFLPFYWILWFLIVGFFFFLKLDKCMKQIQPVIKCIKHFASKIQQFFLHSKTSWRRQERQKKYYIINFIRYITPLTQQYRYGAEGRLWMRCDVTWTCRHIRLEAIRLIIPCFYSFASASWAHCASPHTITGPHLTHIYSWVENMCNFVLSLCFEIVCNFLAFCTLRTCKRQG